MHAAIGSWEDDDLGSVHAYDALHDHAATPLWLHALAEGATLGDVRFVKVGDHALDTEARSTFFSGQQSNSSVIYGDDSLMKVFRRVTTGVNPDIEILAALSEAGNEHIADALRLPGDRRPGHRRGGPARHPPAVPADRQRRLRSRAGQPAGPLRRRRDVHARDAGGDFASESHRLGVALAEMHTTMADAFPTETWDSAHLDALADACRRAWTRLGRRTGIEPHATALHAIFDAVRHHGGTGAAHRVHGDLHLGQTLRTVKNWKIIDFEGEPAKPLAERRRPDSAVARRGGDAALVRLRRRADPARPRAGHRRLRPPRRRAGARVVAAQHERVPGRLPPTPAGSGVDRALLDGVRRGQGGLRGRLRGAQPAGVAADPVGRPGPHRHLESGGGRGTAARQAHAGALPSPPLDAPPARPARPRVRRRRRRPGAARIARPPGPHPRARSRPPHCSWSSSAPAGMAVAPRSSSGGCPGPRTRWAHPRRPRRLRRLRLQRHPAGSARRAGRLLALRAGPDRAERRRRARGRRGAGRGRASRRSPPSPGSAWSWSVAPTSCPRRRFP